MMKKTIVTIACTLIALLAFAQPGSNGTKTTEQITVTGTIIPSTIEDGAAANYQPGKTLVVREDKSENSVPAMFFTAHFRAFQQCNRRDIAIRAVAEILGNRK